MAETATEIAVAGYTNLDIGTQIRDNWTYIEFRDASGGKITRLLAYGTGADTRITPVVADNKKYVTYTCNFTGSATTDTDIAAYMATEGNNGACTFKYAVMKNANTDGDGDLMATDDFTTATIADAADTLQIVVSVGVGVDPQV